MSDPYASAIKSAAAAIARSGQTMTLYRLSLDGEYDPLNPDLSAPVVDIQCPARGVVLPASNGTIEAFDDRILADPLRRQSFRFVILAGFGLTFIPQALDILKTAEGNYRLLGATGLNPAGTGPIIINCGCTLDTQLVIP